MDANLCSFFMSFCGDLCLLDVGKICPDSVKNGTNLMSQSNIQKAQKAQKPFIIINLHSKKRKLSYQKYPEYLSFFGTNNFCNKFSQKNYVKLKL
jgi:hypothetical protein